ncbi:MAG: transcriptional repressor LexA [Treponema sp.]|jgi:repressor LexA|nr:transcriptional repressor LexA [Treponema sp.]
MKELTARQKEVLAFIKSYIGAHSYPPTIRELADNFEISVKGAHDHVIALKKKGFLRQAGKRSRTIELIKPQGGEDPGGIVEIPILGTVAAGLPILSEENFEGTITFHGSMLKKGRSYFAMKVRGESMIGAGINSGDIAIIEKTEFVRNGEITMVVVDDDAITLKRYYKERFRVMLLAENPEFGPTYSQNVRVIGRLARIYRSY